ncbi:MAG: hypothetical protein RSD88_01770 [Anaerovoracaceae bacterium]
MKKTMKSFGMLFLAVMMAFSVTACGSGALDMTKIEGTWGLSSVGGVDFETYCADNGVDPETGNSIWEITATTATITGTDQTQEYKLDVKNNGFEVLNPEDGKVFLSVTYDEGANTLSYKVNDGTKDIEMVLVPYAE